MSRYLVSGEMTYQKEADYGSGIKNSLERKQSGSNRSKKKFLQLRVAERRILMIYEVPQIGFQMRDKSINHLTD